MPRAKTIKRLSAEKQRAARTAMSEPWYLPMISSSSEVLQRLAARLVLESASAEELRRLRGEQ